MIDEAETVTASPAVLPPSLTASRFEPVPPTTVSGLARVSNRPAGELTKNWSLPTPPRTVTGVPAAVPVTVTVTGTAAGTPVTVRGGVGSDQFFVSSPAGRLDTLASPLTVVGGTGSNLLAVSEGGSTAGDAVTVSASSIISSVVGFTVNYSATGTFGGGVFLLTGSGNDTVNVQGTVAGLTSITTGAGDDFVNVGSAAGRLDTLAGALSVAEGGGVNALAVSDAGATPA